jgi:hypothetical protein
LEVQLTQKNQNKTKPSKLSVEEFINNIGHDKKIEESFKILEMMKDVTGLEPVMWGDSIIGFGKYHYKYKTGREGDSMLVGFSPRKTKFSIYLMYYLEKQTDLLDKLGKHKIGRACLYVNKLADIDFDVLRQLVERAFNFMQNFDNNE